MPPPSLLKTWTCDLPLGLFLHKLTRWNQLSKILSRFLGSNCDSFYFSIMTHFKLYCVGAKINLSSQSIIYTSLSLPEIGMMVIILLQLWVSQCLGLCSFSFQCLSCGALFLVYRLPLQWLHPLVLVFRASEMPPEWPRPIHWLSPTQAQHSPFPTDIVHPFLDLSLFQNSGSFMSSWPHHATCGILVSPSGIEPMPPALEAWRLTHWTTRGVPCLFFSKRTPGLGEEDRLPSGWLYCFGWFSSSQAYDAEPSLESSTNLLATLTPLPVGSLNSRWILLPT